MAYNQSKLDEYRQRLLGGGGETPFVSLTCPYCNGQRDARVKHVHPSTKPASPQEFWQHVVIDKFRKAQSSEGLANLSRAVVSADGNDGNGISSTSKDKMFVVGPMVDQSELPFRLLCREYGATLTYTPMLHAKSFEESAQYRQHYLTTSPLLLVRQALEHGSDRSHVGGGLVDRPCFVQFCGHDADVVLGAARWAVRGEGEEEGAATPVSVGDGAEQLYCCDAVDLNLGCPQGIARRGYYGSFLMEDWDCIHAMVHTLHVELEVPVTVKIRVFDKADGSADEALTLAYMRMLQAAGAQVICVHGRTRAMKGQLSGLADMALIARLRRQLHTATADASQRVPVISNGNVQRCEDVWRHLREVGCEGHMCAEPLLWDPTLFSDPALPVPAGRDFGANKPTRLRALHTAARYLQWCAAYPVDVGFIKAHLFKMCHHSYELHTAFREEICSMRTDLQSIAEYRGRGGGGGVDEGKEAASTMEGAEEGSADAAVIQMLQTHIQRLIEAEEACSVEGEQPKTAKAEKAAAKADIKSVFDDEEGFAMDFLF